MCGGGNGGGDKACVIALALRVTGRGRSVKSCKCSEGKSRLKRPVQDIRTHAALCGLFIEPSATYQLQKHKSFCLLSELTVQPSSPCTSCHCRDFS